MMKYYATDRECNADNVCSGGVCRRLCTDTEDCSAEDLVCFGGVCALTCTTGNQYTKCGDRSKCVLGVCSQLCAVRTTHMTQTIDMTDVKAIVAPPHLFGIFILIDNNRTNLVVEKSSILVKLMVSTVSLRLPLCS